MGSRKKKHLKTYFLIEIENYIGESRTVYKYSNEQKNLKSVLCSCASLCKCQWYPSMRYLQRLLLWISSSLFTRQHCDSAHAFVRPSVVDIFLFNLSNVSCMRVASLPRHNCLHVISVKRKIRQ